MSASAPSEREELLAFLAGHPLGRLTTERRRERMLEVLERRLTSITVVLENLYDPHNVAAVIRSADGFGLDRVHVVEMGNKYARNRGVSKGADRWVDIQRSNGLSRKLHDLMAEGFTLAVADVGEGCVPVEELDVSKPIAIIMGSELDGLSKRARSLADVRFTIPMAGFVESFNVSVSAAITLYELTRRRRAMLEGQGELDLETKRLRLHQWLRRSVKHGDRILKEAIGAGEWDPAAFEELAGVSSFAR